MQQYQPTTAPGSRGQGPRRDPRLRFIGRRWPSEEQRLLLIAATHSGEPAVNAWRTWFRTAGFDSAGAAEHSLLPMVASNLRVHGLESAEIPRLKGLYRYNWSRNQLQFQRVKKALSALSAGGIETMVLKGAALTALGYYDRGSRVMTDVDVMVRPEDAERAVCLLDARGWLRTPEHGAPVSQLTSVVHAMALTDRDGANLDLHWHMVHRACSPDADEPFWAAFKPVKLMGEETHAPAPTDLLLHACVHGAAWMPAQSFLWITDALAIIRTGNIDWQRLVELAIRAKVTLSLHRGLSYLEETFAVPVPPEVLRELQRAQTGLLERWQYTIEGGSGLGVINLARDMGRYVSIASGRPLSAKVRGLPLYLQTVWKLESGSQVPSWVVQEGFRRAAAALQARLTPSK
jgi:hypothetical protein